MKRLTRQGEYTLYELLQKDILSLDTRYYSYNPGDILIFKKASSAPRVGTEIARASNLNDALAYIDALPESTEGPAADIPLKKAGPPTRVSIPKGEGKGEGRVGQVGEQPHRALPVIDPEDYVQLTQKGKEVSQSKDALIKNLNDEIYKKDGLIQEQNNQIEELAAEIERLRVDLNNRSRQLLITGEEVEQQAQNVVAQHNQLTELQSENDTLRAQLLSKDMIIANKDSELASVGFTVTGLQEQLLKKDYEIQFKRELDDLYVGLEFGEEQPVEQLSTEESPDQDYAPAAVNGRRENTTEYELPSGGIITVNHSFVPLSKKSKRSFIYTRAKSALTLLLGIVGVFVLFIVVSVFASMDQSGIPVGEYFKGVFESFVGIFGIEL